MRDLIDLVATDDLGPSHVVLLREPALGLEAAVVIDEVSAGPAIGGVRMAADVTVEECARLARAMTLKSAAAGLPHGGAKAVIRHEPAVAAVEKEQLVRAFAVLMRDLRDYIPGPDMGTDETCMAWIRDEIGRAVGLPRELGGIPLDEIGATGFGLAVAVDTARDLGALPAGDLRVAVQGFGAVGRHAARFLAERGAVLVGASDTSGTVTDPAGLDVDALVAHKLGGGRLADLADPAGRAGPAVGPRDAILDVDCDVWIPAARPDVVTMATVERLHTRVVVEGANIPVTIEAERALHARGVLSLPDFVVNAGGLICAATEYRGGTERDAFASIEERIARNTATVLTDARDHEITPREAAERMAQARVRRARALRRWHGASA